MRPEWGTERWRTGGILTHLPTEVRATYDATLASWLGAAKGQGIGDPHRRAALTSQRVVYGTPG